jgi:hypothetical protein
MSFTFNGEEKRLIREVNRCSTEIKRLQVERRIAKSQLRRLQLQRKKKDGR